MKNCINSFIIQYCFPFLLARIFIFLVSLWEICFRCETFFFVVKLLSRRGFFFWCYTFSFLERMILPKVKISGQTYKKDLAGYLAYAYCCEQDISIFWERKKFREKKGFCRLCNVWLVLWTRPFYSLVYRNSRDKVKVYRGKFYHVSETFSSSESLENISVLSNMPNYFFLNIFTLF